MIETGFCRRHQVQKINSQWYAFCGTCFRSLWAQSWDDVFGLLSDHVMTHIEG
jgi:hypothetical protein